jgi:hypothetical protein
MAEPKFYSPLKIGLLIVSISYFLFTLHALFTLSWWGEWEGLPETLASWIFVIDISAICFLVFRFSAGIIAVVAFIFYFTKKSLSAPTTLRILKWILVFEALYWLGLLTSGILGVMPASRLESNVGSLITTGIPCLVSSITIPLALFKLASKLKPNKPLKEAIKWGLIAGTIYVFVFWLNNAGMWIITVMPRGIEYLSYPQNLLSFAVTTIVLLALAVFTAYFTKKTVGTETLEKLELRTLGAIITALGLYFLWNYLTWIFFGGDHLWSDWYAWFLGHNLDLWMLSLPLVGLPLLFKHNK